MVGLRGPLQTSDPRGLRHCQAASQTLKIAIIGSRKINESSSMNDLFALECFLRACKNKFLSFPRTKTRIFGYEICEARQKSRTPVQESQSACPLLSFICQICLCLE